MPTTPQATAHDAGLSAAQSFDRLVVRVMVPLFAIGAAAIGLLWWVEYADDRLSASNRYAYPAMMVLFCGCIAALRHDPRSVNIVRWIGFLTVTLSQFGDLARALLQDGPLVGDYNAVTLLTWLPLIYAVAFLLLDGRAAVWSACVILVLMACGFAWRIASPIGRREDITLLINVLASHAVFIVCLTAWYRMKALLSSQQGLAEKLRVLAATDPLTGLFNRRQALAELGSLVHPPPRVPAPVALLCDVDHFKQVNDQLGHDVGDQVLMDVADALRHATRSNDLVARWGGEEFLVVLSSTSTADAYDLAQRLRQRVTDVSMRGAAGPIGGTTISIGLASHRTDESVTDWLRRTDEALYRAKHAGRNRCEAA